MRVTMLHKATPLKKQQRATCDACGRPSPGIGRPWIDANGKILSSNGQAAAPPHLAKFYSSSRAIRNTRTRREQTLGLSILRGGIRVVSLRASLAPALSRTSARPKLCSAALQLLCL